MEKHYLTVAAGHFVEIYEVDMDAEVASEPIVDGQDSPAYLRFLAKQYVTPGSIGQIRYIVSPQHLLVADEYGVLHVEFDTKTHQFLRYGYVIFAYDLITNMAFDNDKLYANSMMGSVDIYDLEAFVKSLRDPQSVEPGANVDPVYLTSAYHYCEDVSFAAYEGAAYMSCTDGAFFELDFDAETTQLTMESKAGDSLGTADAHVYRTHGYFKSTRAVSLYTNQVLDTAPHTTASE